ncbi:uncharacterized protein LOC8077740 [Sorghum bicolor]|uniref:uncharacterized protein LOC8077740 n=1 Tax=Sorghum bicolor TaxID=4558 RepID=UPI0007F1DA90|nr:uncharacterized protein LOC8077740 [Sorghum bicolor]|eukprot:XP_002438891.2 uncharacterized protein LOC8077740 [Sorghum bicolor]
MAYQLHGGGGGGVAQELNLPPPEGGEQAPPLAAEADRISSLPEKARQHILSFLPLKAAVKLGIASKSWSRLVNTPQWPCDSILTIHIHPATQGPCDCLVSKHIRSDQIVPLLANELSSRGRGPSHRLLRFFLKVDDAQTRLADFYSLLDYAADCDVEEIYVNVGQGPPEVSFNFARASHHLLRLVLVGVGVKEAHRLPVSQVRSINTLEVICIRSASLGDLDLKRALLLCPRLRILVLRDCRVLTCVDVTAASERLVRLTVVECPQVDQISVSAAVGLHSFRYVGDLLRSVALPPTCFGDLRICFTKATLVEPIRFHNWLDALPNLSNLVNLSICSNALKIMSVLRNRENFQPQVAKLSNLQNLRELQLVFYSMNTPMLSHIYGFLRMCRCSQLRNLFLELPKATAESFADAIRGSAEEPPMDGFESLVKVKITNFKWQCSEIEVVHFLFRKAMSLQKLILVAPKGTYPQRDQSGNAIFPDLNLLCVEKTPANLEVQGAQLVLWF